ncbi:MAG: rhodanese-like domain-containing protein [Pseudomonadota bacterium]|nr:rhodanese-like domain-containing protein [Pseudomonadota bacterium]
MTIVQCIIASPLHPIATNNFTSADHAAMDQLSDFVVNHLMLVTAFFVVLGLLISNLTSSAGGVAPQAAVQLINRENAVTIDIRAKSDFESGHIIDAVNIPILDLSQAEEKLKKHKDKPLLVYCGAGSLSRKAVRELKQMGFEQTHALKGGLSAWQGENLPVTSGS